ncbi:hypothetical protein L596_013893 [Steinernema carpocapsae]|uniref:TIL domain-containing protein n=1 Tax=Steinernema carpocapsae TaxID=34508 RepID=A0A4U5P1N4_STECR|nr:hypothetical protein L596_013893 [Steinernema carpocapsae]
MHQILILLFYLFIGAVLSFPLQQPTCGENEEWNEYPLCDRFCNNTQYFCLNIKSFPAKCMCKPNYFRNEENKCVHASECKCNRPTCTLGGKCRFVRNPYCEYSGRCDYFPTCIGRPQNQECAELCSDGERCEILHDPQCTVGVCQRQFCVPDMGEPDWRQI